MRNFRKVEVGNLRKEARGMPCMIRIPGTCNYDEDTTVLAHYRLSGTCGIGMKPDDEQACWACSACHDAVQYEYLRLLHAEAILRTQYARRHGVKP
jgi:hypothetical protein